MMEVTYCSIDKTLGILLLNGWDLLKKGNTKVGLPPNDLEELKEQFCLTVNRW